jgi:hypothetical protein
MTEEQLNKIFQQVFETENGRVILEHLQRVLLESSFSTEQDTTINAILRQGGIELYQYILSRVREEITDQ